MTEKIGQLDKYGYNAIARHLFYPLMNGLMLFWGAGTLDWGWGWAAAGTFLAGWVILVIVLARWNPELLNVRGRRASQMVGTKGWDWIMLWLYFVVGVLGAPLVSGLDFRFGWTESFPLMLRVAGLALMALGFVVMGWAMVVNRHFEGTVRIQAEREHRVVSAGPYRVVRHPGYLGLLLQMLAAVLIAGTWAALIPTVLTIVIFVIRTALEDRTLQTELPGYAQFAQATRYRLLPGVW